jgi:hypothetical protein
MDNPPVAGFFVPEIDWHDSEDSEGKTRKARPGRQLKGMT